MSGEQEYALADVAEGVYRLIRKFGLEPFEQMLFEWAEASDGPVVEFDKARKEHLFRAVHFEDRLRDQSLGPPDSGWKWEWDGVTVADVRQTQSAWFPPHLLNAVRPYPEYPLPLPENRELTLPEKYAALIAIHALHWKGEQIAPWTAPEAGGEVDVSVACSLPAGHKDSAQGWIVRQFLVRSAGKTPESDARNLRYILEDVKADLGEKHPPQPPEPLVSESEDAQHPGLTSGEFNPLARDYLKKHATPERRVTARELADYLKGKNPAGTCSTSVVANLPAWRAYQDKLELEGKKGRKKEPKAVAFTDKLEATTGETDPELQRLVEEHEADREPSSLEDDPPDAPPRRVYERKRV